MFNPLPSHVLHYSHCSLIVFQLCLTYSQVVFAFMETTNATATIVEEDAEHSSGTAISLSVSCKRCDTFENE
jgi:hypothetical protein